MVREAEVMARVQIPILARLMLSEVAARRRQSDVAVLVELIRDAALQEFVKSVPPHGANGDADASD